MAGFFPIWHQIHFFFQYLLDDVFLLFFCLTMSPKSRKNVAKIPPVGHIIITQLFAAYRGNSSQVGKTLMHLCRLARRRRKNFSGCFLNLSHSKKKNPARKWCNFFSVFFHKNFKPNSYGCDKT